MRNKNTKPPMTINPNKPKVVDMDNIRILHTKTAPIKIRLIKKAKKQKEV